MIQTLKVQIEVTETNKTPYLDVRFEIPLEADARDVAKYLAKIKTRVIELQENAKRQEED